MSKGRDRLDEMFYMQDNLNARFEVSSKNIAAGGEENQRHWGTRFASALQAEVIETKEALSKEQCWWKNKTKSIPECKEEIIDQFHFVMSEFLALGGTSDEFFQMYLDKNGANHVRKDWNINREPGS